VPSERDGNLSAGAGMLVAPSPRTVLGYHRLAGRRRTTLGQAAHQTRSAERLSASTDRGRWHLTGPPHPPILNIL
jgi:hypothetical protein